MSLRTVIYVRKSSKDEDEKQIESIPRQKQDIAAFLDRYNAIQTPENRLSFHDEDLIAEDHSAKYPGRPKFNEMIELIRKNKYDVLLCTELSRLSRNAIDTGALIQLLEDEKLQRIQTLDKQFSISPTDKFTLALFLTVAKYENDQRGLNTSSGMQRQKSLGKTTHKAPLGYRNATVRKGESKIERDIVWNDIRRLWDLFMTGDYSVSDISREASERGVTGIKRGGKRTAVVESTFRGMFRNPYYTGKVQHRNHSTKLNEWIDGEHEAMVTREEFDRVQLILQGQGYRHQEIKDLGLIETMLREIVICGKCSTKMTFEWKRRYTCARCKHRYSASDLNKPCPSCSEPVTEKTRFDEHRYYRCGKKRSSEACAHNFDGDGEKKNIPAQQLLQFLEKELGRLYISDKLFAVLRKQLYTLWERENASVSTRKKRLRENIKKLEDERAKITRAEFTEKMSSTKREDLDHALDAIRDEIEGLNNEIENQDEATEETFERAWQTLQVLRDMKNVFQKPNVGIEPKRKLLLSLVSNLNISDKKWEVIWKKPFGALAKPAIAKKTKELSNTENGDSNLNWLPRLDSNQ